MIRKLFALGALSLAAACTEPGVQTVGAIPVLSNAQLQIVGDTPLGVGAAASLRSFEAERQAFGAMYVTRDGSGWYWRTGSFAFVDVDREARTVCEAENDQPCVRHAILMPATGQQSRGIPVRAVPDIQLSMDRTASGLYGAVAVMRTGAYGYSYNFETPEGAAKRALEECRERLASEREKISAQARNAVARAGGFDCAIYFEFQGQ